MVVIELLGASSAGLKALKSSWKSINNLPVICLISRKNRKDVIQASALGKVETLDYDGPLALLIQRIKMLAKVDLEAVLPENTPRQTVTAYTKSSAFLESLCFSITEGSQIRVKLMNECAEEVLTALTQNGLSYWLRVVETHYSPSCCHSLQVAGLAGMLAKYMNWSKADCKEVVAGGLFHDVGKKRIPLAILDKADKLTPEERRVVDMHPLFGRDILKARPEISPDVKRMAIQHHEYLDGTGYPGGLKGEQLIPKVRLLTICDVFTALTEERTYKERQTVYSALSTLKTMGPKLDQELVAGLSDMLLDRDLGAIAVTKPIA